MRFEHLLRHVQRAERRVEQRAADTQSQWAALKQTWREGWTPGRILIAGVVSGFLVGRAEPLRTLTGTRWMQMFSAVSRLLATAQAAATDTLQDAQEAQEAQDRAEAGMADEEPQVDTAFDEDEVVVTAPRPAEAATELSER